MFAKMKKSWITSAHQGIVKGNMHSNTLDAYLLAAKMGADMIETDARMTKDGVLIVNHDAEVRGFDEKGNPVCYTVSETPASVITKVILAKGENVQYVPTLKQTLDLAYHTGLCVNIDLKEGITNAEQVARLVTSYGMRGRTVYATNGAGIDAIRLIRGLDPDARFIDTKSNFTAEKLSEISDYPARCYVYTWDFSDGNIAEIRDSLCMLAAISIGASNAESAFRHHPDMAEYPHTSDFSEIEKNIALKL